MKEINNGIANVQIMGVNTALERALAISVESAALELKIPIEIEFISDIDRFIAAGIIAIPALFINNNIVSMGILPDIQEIIHALQVYGPAQFSAA
ncbi:MAG: thioredoxin family protein [Lewinellaceae bacterium]|nr:thioredoxin family protein [Lewinellaceae bacterium]